MNEHPSRKNLLVVVKNLCCILSEVIVFDKLGC